MAFLLGSGASIGAGLPSTAALTRAVVCGDGYMRHPDGCYYKGQPPYAHMGWPDTHVPHISEFLQWLRHHVSDYYCDILRREVNYEDLYYLAEQIHDEESGDIDNPFIRYSEIEIRKMIHKCRVGIQNSPASSKSSTQCTIIIEEMIKYIIGVVKSELSKQPTSTTYLTFLREAQASLNIGPINIFTLNHDLLVDQYLRDNGVEVIDGFGPSGHSLRYWDPNEFSAATPGCTLLKLHGSINWYRYRDVSWRADRVGCCLDNRDPDHTKDRNGCMPYTSEGAGRPRILVGTFNKMLAYTNGIFADLFCEFRRRLARTDALIICGYGFGDKGINSQLVHWAFGEGRRMLVVHPEPENLLACARGAIQENWDDWNKEEVLRLHCSKIEDLSWCEIQKSLFD